MKSNLTGIVLLAAGASVRMGEAKQLLEFQEKTLLRRSAETALQITDKVVVTLGARSEILHAEIKNLPVQIAENRIWQTGMGSSIRIGLEKLLKVDEFLKSAVILVCDQPFVSIDLLNKLITEFENTNAPIIACEYENTLGVPALFSAEVFPELLALDSEHGAKFLIKKHLSNVIRVSFPKGSFDIDTPADYEKLITNFT